MDYSDRLSTADWEQLKNIPFFSLGPPDGGLCLKTGPLSTNIQLYGKSVIHLGSPEK